AYAAPGGDKPVPLPRPGGAGGGLRTCEATGRGPLAGRGGAGESPLPPNPPASLWAPPTAANAFLRPSLPASAAAAAIAAVPAVAAAVAVPPVIAALEPVAAVAAAVWARALVAAAAVIGCLASLPLPQL